ncbi:MAG: VanW family protein [Flaviflexus sp.]|nr:VanW family protein [Flaviflexus sp.]
MADHDKEWPEGEAPAFLPASDDEVIEVEGETGEEADASPKKRKKRLVPLLSTLGIIALLVAAYGGVAAYFAGRTPANATIAGVDIGGMTAADAQKKLEADTTNLVTEAVPVTVAGTDLSGEVDPVAAGVELDYDTMIDRLTGFTLNPALLWDRMTGGGAEDVLLTYDEEQLRAQLIDLNESIHVAPENASISFAGSTIETTDEVEGTGIDIDAAQDTIGQGWVSAPRPIEVPAIPVDPEITNEDIEQVRSTQAEPLVSGPVEVTVGETTARLTEADLAAAASFEPADGTLKLNLDTDQLVEAVRSQVSDLLVEPKDARIELDGHNGPVVIESVDGKSIDEEQLGEKIDAAAFASGEARTVAAELTIAKPELTTEKAHELGVKEVVASIETPLTANRIRTQNLITGTQLVNGTLVMPGEEFSLLTALGPITAERGFVSSGVVVEGFATTALGGGLSQLSTNTFNLGYRSGMEDIQHKPHSRYFSRYPRGVESTLWSPDLDMRWKNTTPYAALVETWVADGQVKARLWSTKYYDVDLRVSEPYNVKQPSVKTNTSPDCVPHNAGGPGFSVDVHRIVSHDGKTVYDNSYTWTYQPSDAERCG